MRRDRASAGPGARLEIRNLEVVYGKGASALVGVSMTMEPGSFTAVLGANGAGKTTMVRAITGMLSLHGGRIRSGEVVLDGRDVTSASAKELVSSGVCQVPEGRMVFGRLSVVENLKLGAATRRDSMQVGSDIEAMFALFPFMSQRQGDPAGLLSGGEQQMLAIARALMARPSLLIIDELSLGLAPLVIRDIFERLHAIHRGGTTIVTIEQNARAALQHVQWGYVVQGGRVLAHGSADDLQRDPKLSQLYLGGSAPERPPDERVGISVPVLRLGG